MKIIFLGTCGSALTADLTYSSILINQDLLLDCGEGCTNKVLKLGVIENLKTICITHLHNDHFLGLFSILWYYWIVTQRKESLKIIGPPKTEFTVRKILGLINTPKNALKFEMNFIELEDIETVQVIENNGYHIKAIKMDHHPISFGYRVEDSNKKSVFYTGDTKPNDRIVKISKNCDLLIIESTFPDDFSNFAHKYHHCTPYDAGLLAQKAEVKKLALTHISSLFQNEKEIKKIEKQAKKQFKNEVIIAKDLLTIEI
ncbi:MAG: MBL fold metallo-hydrolase [Promethearchaeota archaeon]|nr:MAG: MBL fold metallo-hydrolase [Candidatus Lokiarchaeota archaeon]